MISGITPNMVVMVVIMIGRKRAMAEMTIAL